MVTYCVTKIIPTYSPVIEQFFDTVPLHQLIKSGNYDASKSTSWKVLETVLSHLKLIYRLFVHLFCHSLLALGLNTFLKKVSNYCYVY